MTTGSAALMRNAESMLDSYGGAHAPRMAAFLARQALEELVAERCRVINVDTGRGSMASQLIVLRVLDEAGIAATATVAWNGLSNACHHHAYELAPTVSEVRHLCRLVATLLPGSSRPSQSSSA